MITGAAVLDLEALPFPDLVLGVLPTRIGQSRLAGEGKGDTVNILGELPNLPA